MESSTLGIIGYGNMGTAIIKGLIDSGLYQSQALYACDISAGRNEAAQKDGCTVLSSIKELGKVAQVVIIAVKPVNALEVLHELRDCPSKNLIISIVAGLSTQTIDSILHGKPVIRVMPNTPCMISQGASAITRGKNAGDEHVKTAMDIMGALGYVTEVSERLMDAVTGLSGSGPAYVALMIDALTDGGVKMGLPRPTALRLAAQTVLGAAKMIIDRNMAPSALRDMVTSPGGTTIEGISVLESQAFRAALIRAVEAATLKSEALGKK